MSFESSDGDKANSGKIKTTIEKLAVGSPKNIEQFRQHVDKP